MENQIIGIDLGHCETAAAIPAQLPAEKKYTVKRLTSKNKDTVINTQIILTNEQMNLLKGKLRPTYDELNRLGDIQIGSNLPEYVQNGEKFSYFKMPPKDFDEPYGNSETSKACGITHGQLIACYVFALVNSLYKYNREELTMNRSSLELLIGCPATQDWTSSEARKKYAGLVKTATGVKSVYIVPESRAAMFSSVSNERNSISAVKGAVVFDFGSSTADCTYMLMGRKIIEFSWELGASKIEREMAKAGFEAAVKIKGPFTPDLISFAAVENEMRTIKEGYYCKQYDAEPGGHPVVCRFQSAEDGSIVPTLVTINDNFMKQVTEEAEIQIRCDSKTNRTGSWAELCEAFFEEAKKKIEEATYPVPGGKSGIVEQRCTIDTVVLTGGACQMDFVYALCKKVFHQATVVREDTPSYTVSNGLGWVAVSDSNLDTCKEAALQEIKSKQDSLVEKLRNDLSGAVFNIVRETAKKITDEWAQAPGDTQTVRMLQTRLTEYIDSEEGKNELTDTCNQVIKAWKDNLSDNMETAVNNQVKKLYSEAVAKALIIPKDIWKQLQATSLSLDKIDVAAALKDIDLSGLGAIISKLIIKAVIWAIAGALAFESWGISMLIAWILDDVVDSLMSDEKLDKPRKQSLRLKVAKKITNQLNNKKTEIMGAFEQNLNILTVDFDKMLDSSLTTAFEIVTLKRFEM